MRAILTYHSIDDSGSPVSVPEAAFRRHARWLVSGAVGVAELAKLPELDDGHDAVALTFDDAFVSFREIAWPVLREHRVPVTLFVVTDRVGGTNAWGELPERGIPTMPLLDWDALGELHEQGVSLGAHTRTHPDLRTLAGSALEDEVAGAAEQLLARTGARPATFAYPYGGCSPAVAAAAARTYRVACTTEHRLFRPREDPYRLPRLDAFYFRDRGLEGWGSASFRARVRLRGALRRMRGLTRRVAS